MTKGSVNVAAAPAAVDVPAAAAGDGKAEVMSPVEAAAFVNGIQALKVGESAALLELIEGSLPLVNSVMGRGHTMSRLCKYLRFSGFFEADYETTWSNFKKKDHDNLRAKVILAFEDPEHFENMKQCVLDGFADPQNKLGKRPIWATNKPTKKRQSTTSDIVLLTDLPPPIPELVKVITKAPVAAASASSGRNATAAPGDLRWRLDVLSAKAEHLGRALNTLEPSETAALRKKYIEVLEELSEF